jgi:hypothetical protein
MNTLATLLLAGTAYATRQNVVLDSTRPSDYDSATNSCTSSQKRYLQDALDIVFPMAQDSVATTKFNTSVFTKWFGEDPADHADSDSDTLSRMVDATAMLDRMDDSWDPVCCNSGNSGTCWACSAGTLAFVTSYSWSDGTKQSVTWVRTCPDFWAMGNDMKLTAGFVLYHELIHMVSGAGDGYGAYSKSAGVKLAADDSSVARLQANNYMLYAMQNSMSPYDYANATTSWGNSVF